ncbi:MAG: radical SAM protein [Spirochaetaceae bacterium]|nr:radical SAM protein [Spirochaetaceae bacterium]
MSSFTEIEAKSGLSRARLPDAFLVSLYRALAPYRGCGHGCAYCDGRAERYYVDGDFERDIAVRRNLPERVALDVAGGAAAREYGAVCIGSGVTDVYQPAERGLGLTRRALEALAPAGLPVVILTKSDLVLRDFDVLSRFPKALVVVTVTTTDDGTAAMLEPGASPPAARLAVVREARARGFRSGVMAMPLCPGLSDGDGSVGSLLDASIEAGAEFVYPGGLTLRPGRQKDHYMAAVERRGPALRAEYDELYAGDRPSGMPSPRLAAEQAKRLDRLVRERGLPTMIPHGVYRELLSPPDALYVLFCHMQGLYAARGVDVRPLRAATGRYADWLAGERTALRRSLGRNRAPSPEPFPVTGVLTERLLALSEGGGLAEVLGNARLAALAANVLAGGAFDYTTLRVGAGVPV